MDSRAGRVTVLIVLMLQVLGALAQSSSSHSNTSSTAASGVSSSSDLSSASSLTTSSSTTTSTPTTVVATGIPSPTVSMSASILTACEETTITFSAPAVPKYLAIWTEVNSQPEILEIYYLPDEYTPSTTGYFTWLVDLPAGLTIGFEFYVQWNGTQTGLPGTYGSTQPVKIGPGSDDNCFASNNNVVEKTSEIIAFATQLNPEYSPSKSTSSAVTAGTTSVSSGGGSTNIAGPVAGGVVGGVAVIAIVAALLFWLKRRQEREAAGAELGSQWGGQSEKSGRSGTSRYPMSSVGGAPPPSAGGFYIPYDEFGNPLVDPSGGQMLPLMSPGAEEPQTPARPMAAPGTLPEPMDADSTPRDPGPRTTPPPPSPFTPVTPAEEARQQLVGSEGLEDPSAFTPRSTRVLDDPASFSAAGSTRS